MRLIDADILSEEIKNGAGTDLQKLFADICLATAPTIDAVPVVRCSDCVHFEPFRRHDGFCKIDGMLRENDFFCKHGQRREDGDE